MDKKEFIQSCEQYYKEDKLWLKDYENPGLKYLDNNPKETALRELSIKNKCDLLGTEISDVFVNSSKDLILETLQSSVCDATAIYTRFLSLCWVLNRHSNLPTSHYLSHKNFEGYTRLTPNTLDKVKKTDKLDNVQKAFLIQVKNNSILSSDLIIEKLSPVHHGYFLLADHICHGLHKVFYNIYKIQKHLNFLLQRNLAKSPLALQKLVLQGAPSYLYDSPDLGIKSLPPLFSIGFLYYNFCTADKPDCYLDQHYNCLDNSYIELLNTLTPEEFDDYLTIGLYYINLKNVECADSSYYYLNRFLKCDILNTPLDQVSKRRLKKIPRISKFELKNIRETYAKRSVTEKQLKLYNIQRQEKIQRNKEKREKLDFVNRTAVTAAKYLDFCNRYGLSYDKRLFELMRDGIVQLNEVINDPKQYFDEEAY